MSQNWPYPGLPSAGVWRPSWTMVAANFRYEMDLSREASSVRRFADAWRDSPDIVLPDVVDELCTSTVMVQQFSRGAHLHGLPPAMGAAAAGKLVDS